MSTRNILDLPQRRAPRRALFICGSIHQTSQLRQVARALPSWDVRFTPYYADSLLDLVARLGLVEFSIVGRKRRGWCLEYLRAHHLPIDLDGRGGHYDLVVTCADVCVPRNIRGNRLVLVQEGLTDPEGLVYSLVRRFGLPRYLAGTAAMGLSHAYDCFCVASEGYRRLFARKGVPHDRMMVTGIPNFDDCRRYLANDFPHRGYVLVCTSDIRELWGREDRPAFIRECVRLASGRPLIFKLHPNEQPERATREVLRHAPGARVYREGSAEEMIANCDVLISQWSSVAFVGLALGKEVHSFFDREELRTLLPEQHGSAARNIAAVCRSLVGDAPSVPRTDGHPRTVRLRGEAGS